MEISLHSQKPLSSIDLINKFNFIKIKLNRISPIVYKRSLQHFYYEYTVLISILFQIIRFYFIEKNE